MRKNINNLLDSLSKAKFRGSFYLNQNMKHYVMEKGIDIIEEHAYKFVTERLKDKNPKNDGKQTPMKQVHPVFIAAHATGCCCRSCLLKIHKIQKEKELTEEEISYVVEVLITWIQRQMNKK